LSLTKVTAGKLKILRVKNAVSGFYSGKILSGGKSSQQLGIGVIVNSEDSELLLKAMDALEDIQKNPQKVDAAYCPSCLAGRLSWVIKEHYKHGGHWICDHCGRWFQKGFSYEGILRQHSRK